MVKRRADHSFKQQQLLLLLLLLLLLCTCFGRKGERERVVCVWWLSSLWSLININAAAATGTQKKERMKQLVVARSIGFFFSFSLGLQLLLLYCLDGRGWSIRSSNALVVPSFVSLGDKNCLSTRQLTRTNYVRIKERTNRPTDQPTKSRRNEPPFSFRCCCCCCCCCCWVFNKKRTHTNPKKQNQKTKEEGKKGKIKKKTSRTASTTAVTTTTITTTATMTISRLCNNNSLQRYNGPLGQTRLTRLLTGMKRTLRNEAVKWGTYMNSK